MKNCMVTMMKKKNIQMVNYRSAAIGIIEKPDLKPLPVDTNPVVPEPMETRNVRFDGEKMYVETKIYKRDDLPIGCKVYGPAIIEQMDSTCIIPPRWIAYVDSYLNLIVTYEEV